MTPTKIGLDQHNILHRNFPDDCCLCKVEKELSELKQKFAQLEGLLIKAGLQGVLDKLEKKDKKCR